ncbi:MAG: hypothetical protein EBU90_10130 [Proteobacteria bacterium]|nr:hypothetical protein [Pseudomonadota bacterium]
MRDTAIIVTSYCGGNFQEEKRKMTKTICKKLFNAGHFVVLASHSTIDEQTQEYCDLFVYDRDNRFSFDGIPTRTTNHGVAELTSIHNALKLLPKQYKNILKMSYDNQPDLDYHDIITKCKETNKRAVTAKWGNDVTLGTQMFFSDIEFFNQTLSMNELYRCEKDLEYVWFDSVADKNLLNEVEILDIYRDFLGHNVLQYAHAAGTSVDHYPYD